MSDDGAAVARRAVEEAARTSYGRLVSYLASATADAAGAEDAVADAFEAALRSWPERGVPDRPTSWLLTAARRSAIGRSRRRSVAERALPSLALLVAERSQSGEPSPIGDRRLELLFSCAHPAIDAQLHAPLMLQIVMGLDVARMAPAFQVSPAALSQRLVRGKRKVRDAGIAFAAPERWELGPRVAAVLEAIHVVHVIGSEDPPEADAGSSALVDEAIHLATLTASLLDDPEAHALAALLLYRRAALLEGTGRVVHLGPSGAPGRSADLLARAAGHLDRAALVAPAPGRYLVRAAIEAGRHQRARGDVGDRPTVGALADGRDRAHHGTGAGGRSDMIGVA